MRQSPLSPGRSFNREAPNFPPKLRDREPMPLGAVKPQVLGTYGRYGDAVAVPKTERAKGGKDEQRHKNALAQLGCMVCRRLFPMLAAGPVELHHRRSGGWGKGDYTTLMPLCPEHHRGATGVHGLGTKGFAKHYGFDQQDLLNDALALIGEVTA